MIRHIVLWRLKDEAQGRSREENAREIKKQLEALNGRVPGLIRIDVGLDESKTPDSADIALYSEFDTPAALAAYQVHPDHVAFKGFMQSVRLERVVVDYVAPCDDPR